MMRRLLLLALVCIALPNRLTGQPLSPRANPLFDDTVLPTISITTDPAYLDAIFGDVESDEEYPATFTFETGQAAPIVVENVGFRLRGNTSRRAQKKSFKVSFNTFVPGGDLFGIEKLNLNGEHNDPSIIRSKLSWDLFQQARVPASRANHVRLFINGTYYGLYINVEHIDEEFTASRFGTKAGSLYKNLYPADLVYLGPNASDYYPHEDGRPYEYKSGPDEEGYADLAQFIDVLNNTPDNLFPATIQDAFDVNGFLRTLAIDVVTGSWDDYWYLKNNYYLYYHPFWEQFVYIPYDFDNTFGIDWIGQDGADPDWGTRDVYAWGHLGEPRPLANRLMAVEDFRDRYTFYLRRTLEQWFTPEQLNPRIDALFARIQDAAEADPFRTLDYDYSIEDFRRSYTEPLGMHVEYGLKPFIITRHNTALEQLDAVNVPPILSYRQHTPRRPQTASPLTVTILIEDEDPATVTATLVYRFTDGPEETLPLRDDGLHGDGAPNDGLYGAQIPAPERTADLVYAITATDANGQERRTTPQTVPFGFDAPTVVINEFMARNATTIADESGAFPDWVELYNTGTEPVSLGGVFLTDDLAQPDRWAFPDTTILPGAFVLVWADDDDEDEGLHTNFQLSGDGEELGLFFQDGTAFAAIDSLRFGPQETDVSVGRLVDGGATFGELPTPSPGQPNALGGVATVPAEQAAAFVLGPPYPNPFTGATTLPLRLNRTARVQVDVFDLLGRRVWHAAPALIPSGTHRLTWDGTHIDGTTAPAGLYLLRVRLTGLQTATYTYRVIRLR